MRFSSMAVRLILATLTSAAVATAQEKPKELPDAPAPKGKNAPRKQDNPLHATIEILEQRSLFFPELAATPGPLSARQKFELFADESIAPSRMAGSGFGAGISQARNSLAGYGQGMSGFGKRFGASMATAASSNFFGTFVLASTLRSDPRYFVTLRGGPGRRIAYGLSRIVATRTDAGGQAVNWAGLLGPLFAEGLANTYLPVKEQTTGRTFQRYGIRVGTTAATNILREYWPTIFRSLRMGKLAPSRKPAPAPPPAAPPSGPRAPSDQEKPAG